MASYRSDGCLSVTIDNCPRFLLEQLFKTLENPTLPPLNHLHGWLVDIFVDQVNREALFTAALEHQGIIAFHGADKRAVVLVAVYLHTLLRHLRRAEPVDPYRIQTHPEPHLTLLALRVHAKAFFQRLLLDAKLLAKLTNGMRPEPLAGLGHRPLGCKLQLLSSSGHHGRYIFRLSRDVNFHLEAMSHAAALVA
ncbi:hypothetical protein [Vibrio phage VP882]|uniref:Uncharacterized protein n=1 Tax=Vibrio phage VP882 TaxID=2913982 RepID=A2I2X2_9CAUD|nr:hypothetical protein VPVV882_gp12 [Vibrio phage VP882]ABM73386.1 hypothetical protein [Vibrio phage VP882]